MRKKSDSSPIEICLTVPFLLEKAGEDIYRRGRAYWKQGKVESLLEMPDGIAALVRGGDSYQVFLQVKKNRLRGACSCPAAKGDVGHGGGLVSIEMGVI